MNFVYITTNVLNEKKYVGSHCTENINDGYLGSGRTFKKAIKKYGKENFKREILKECETIEEARNLEGRYIKKYKTLIPNGYNFHPNGGPTNGGFHSEETKRKMSEAAKKRWKDKEERKKQSERLRSLGLKHSDETKQKIGDIHRGKESPMKGKNHCEETKEKIRQKLLGTKLPEEVKKKISKNSKRHKPWLGKKLSEEHRKNIGESNKGKTRSEETKSKIGNSRKKYLKENPQSGYKNPFYGKKHSEETRKKMKEAWKKRKQ